MTNRTRERSLDNHAPDLPPRFPVPADRSIQNAGLIAGASLMLMAALAGFGNFVVIEGLVTPGDAAQTARDVVDSDGLFRLGVAMMYLVIVLDVVLAWALLMVFSPVSRDLSRLTAWFRLAYAGVFMVALGHLAGIPDLLTSQGYSTAFTPEQLQAQALLKTDSFNDIWMAGLLLFGVHLFLLGVLVIRSGYVPKVIGALLLVAGVGYPFDTFVSVFSEGSPFAISTFTFLGEFLLGLWLLVRGRRIHSGSELS